MGWKILWFDQNEILMSSALNGREDARRFKDTLFMTTLKFLIHYSKLPLNLFPASLISLNCPWLKLGCLMLAGCLHVFKLISELWLLLGKGLPMRCPPVPALIPTFYLIHSTRHNLSFRIGWTLFQIWWEYKSLNHDGWHNFIANIIIIPLATVLS